MSTPIYFLQLTFLTQYVLTKTNGNIIGSFSKIKSPDICRTCIFTYFPEEKDLQYLIPFFTTVVLSPESLSLNLKYDVLSFRKELKTEHVITPTRLGVTKFTRNCASVLISENEDKLRMDLIVNLLVSRRFARPHKDYFFFQFKHQPPPQNFKKVFVSLRYKFIVQKNGDDFISFCGEFQSLFSHMCPAIISGERLEMAASNTPALFRPNPTGGSGALYRAFKEIDHRYNSTSFIRQSSLNGSAGMRLNNGTGPWKGTVGDVFDRLVNISIATGMTRERLRFTDFSVTHLWNERVFFIRTPPVTSNWLTLIRPLTGKIWVLFILTLLILVLPVMYVTAVSQSGFTSQTKIVWFNLNMLYKVGDIIWCVLFEQSTFTRDWQGTRVRLVIILWTALCLVVTTGYKSKLVNFLTFTDRDSVPETHLELSLSDYKLFFRSYKGIVLLETRESTNPMHKRFMAKSKFYDHSLECLMDALTTEKSACLDFILNGEYTLAINTSLNRTGDLRIFVRSKDIDIRWMIMWIFPKGSPLTATYDRIKCQFLATGLFDKWIRDDWALKKIEGTRWLESKRESKVYKVINGLLDELEKIPGRPLTIPNVMTILLIWGIGLGLGSLSCIGEILGHYSLSCIRHSFYYCTRWIRRLSVQNGKYVNENGKEGWTNVIVVAPTSTQSRPI